MNSELEDNVMQVIHVIDLYKPFVDHEIYWNLNEAFVDIIPWQTSSYSHLTLGRAMDIPAH